MKKIILILIILIFAKQSYALECIACEVSDTESTCDLSYKCPKGTKYCETLVSKVEGSYSVVLSCATEEKCEAEPILEDGLEECNHDDDNTECYSCCKGDDCNTLEDALAVLPEDIFEVEKPAKKGKKPKAKKVVEDDEETEEIEDDEEEEDNKELKKKSKDKKTKGKAEEPEEDEDYSDDSEEPEEKAVESEEKSDDSADEVLPNNNDSPAEVDEVPQNETVIEQKSADNQTVVATNQTANATEEGTGNNVENVEVIKPLDPLEAINKALNETVEVIANLDNAGNAENVEPNPENVDPKLAEENSGNVDELQENKTEDGTEYNAPQNPEEDGEESNIGWNENGDSNIMTESENADEIGEQNELFDAPSSSTKYQMANVLLYASLILISIRLF